MQVGHDELGRPIIYSCLRNASNRSTEDNRRHMLATFEQVRQAPSKPAHLSPGTRGRVQLQIKTVNHS